VSRERLENALKIVGAVSSEINKAKIRKSEIAKQISELRLEDSALDLRIHEITMKMNSNIAIVQTEAIKEYEAVPDPSVLEDKPKKSAK
jgi:hypothetical protein